MSELSQFIFGILQTVFWLVLMYLVFDWVIRFFFPSAKWHKKLARNLIKKTISLFIMPFEKLYEASKWLITRAFTTTPEFNHRQIFLEDYPVTPLEFYDLVEEAFRTRQITDAEVLRITRRELHFLSPRRVYLLIRFRQSAYFISGVPLGTSFLVTLRFTENPSKFLLILFQIPFIGAVVERLLSPPTFYRDDIYYAFEQIARSSVLEATNMLAMQGVRPLNETEQIPLLLEYYE